MTVWLARPEEPPAGVPVAVKDLFDVEGHETTGCCAAYRGNVARRDAEVVTRLRRAGAVIVGKCNQHELAFGTTNLISACGPAHNPFDPERIVGGSSGGSAAAVAARCVRIALGTDTGGSIRIPSSYCGLFGLKPTHGRLSLEGVMPLAASLDCPGPIASTASDLALAWKALSGEGEAPSDAPAARVAILRTERATEDVLDAIDATADAVRRLGAQTVDVSDGLAGVADPWLEVAAPEFLAAHGALLERRDDVHPFIAAYLDFASTLPAAQADEGRARAEQIREWFEEQLRDADALLMPATPYTAPLVTDEAIMVRSGDTIDVHLGGASTFTRAVNLAGLPSLAIPAGVNADGMPVGLQLVGGRGTESVLLATAAALEELDERFRSPVPAPPAR